jgi:hypothetical protein
MLEGLNWAPCADCTRETAHEILYNTSKTNGNSQNTTTYAMIRCRGCFRISFTEVTETHKGGTSTFDIPKTTRMGFSDGIILPWSRKI